MPKRSSALAPVQDELDEAAHGGKISEAVYLQLCKRIKTAYDAIESEDNDVRLNMYAEMVTRDSDDVVLCAFDDIDPLDTNVMTLIFTMGIKNYERWWKKVLSEYMDLIVNIMPEDSDVQTADVLWKLIELIGVIPSKVHELMCTELESSATGLDCIMSMCKEDQNFRSTNLKRFLLDLVMLMPRVIILLGTLQRKHHLLNGYFWMKLVCNAREAATKSSSQKSLWGDAEFIDTVGTFETRKHQTTATRVGDTSSSGSEEEEDE